MGATASKSSGDVNSFRNAVKSGILPPSSSITFSGMFNEHTYVDSQKDPTTDLLVPVGDFGVDINPLTKEEEVWAACFMKSSKDGNPTRTKHINIVIVLDISGSMMNTLTEPKTEEDLMSLPPKLEVAKKSIFALFKNMLPDDKLGVVTFHEKAMVVEELKEIKNINEFDFEKKINDISAGGGTVLVCGMKEATKMLETENNTTVENRIIFLTDMCDSSEDHSGPEKLFEISKENSKKGIYASYIGVGVDFNTDVMEKITRVRGSNYFCIFTMEEFEEMLTQEFNYNFFPMAYNVELQVSLAGGYVLDRVYGTSYDDEMKIREGSWTSRSHKLYRPEFQLTVRTFLLCANRNGLPQLPLDILATIFNHLAPALECITYIDTVFPSSKLKNETKGGLMLMKLVKTDPHLKSTPFVMKMELRYEVDGIRKKESTDVCVDPSKVGYYSSEGIEKGILLQRYVSTLKTYLEAPKDKDCQNKLAEFVAYFANQSSKFGPLLVPNLLTLQNFVSKNIPQQETSANCLTM